MQITNELLEKLRSDLMQYVSGKRLTHSYAVEREAASLGLLYGIEGNDLARLKAAAILHDITKEKKLEAQLQLCEKHGIPVTEDDIDSPKVFHSVTGAYEARSLYPEIVDEEMFNAIRYHTTGRTDMTLFDRLIYLADYIEETRDFDDCVKLREYFYSKPATLCHLSETILLSFDMTLKNLIDEGQSIHPLTNQARKAIIKELKKC